MHSNNFGHNAPGPFRHVLRQLVVVNDITENINTCMQMYMKLVYNPSTDTAEMLPNLICKMYLDIVAKYLVFGEYFHGGS